MTNPILLSESFDKAAYTLARSLDNFGTGDFDESVRKFERSVGMLQRVLGMQAENMQRAAVGQSMAYVEVDFQNV